MLQEDDVALLRIPVMREKETVMVLVMEGTMMDTLDARENWYAEATIV